MSDIGRRLDLPLAAALRVPAVATVRTQVDKVARTVVVENLTVGKSDFPRLPDRGAACAAELARRVASDVRTISLDRLEAAAAAGVKAPPEDVDDTPAHTIVSNHASVLVPIDGAPALKSPAGQIRFECVINMRALILKSRFVAQYYLHVCDGWMTATSVTGPWSVADPSLFVRRGIDALAADLAKQRMTDMLDGGPKASPKPSLASAGAALVIYAAQGPAEVVVFDSQPDFVPINGTQLSWASNTYGDVLIDTTSRQYYVLLAGRWFRAPELAGPWSYVANDALPADFAKIPPTSLAGAVLPSVAGTPHAQSALIANSIPQTATVPWTDGPFFTPSFNGVPKFHPIGGTPLTYVANSAVPIVRVDAASFFAVSGGTWFTATALNAPWTVVASVPVVIYTIPAFSPLHCVTYVRIYEATPNVVYVGYMPGDMGTVISLAVTVVYGTGFAYSPWIGLFWYPAPVTYTVAATPICNPYVGSTFSFAMGMAACAWTYPYYGGVWYHPAYWGGHPCCGTASVNVYGQWGNTVASGRRSWYAGGGTNTNMRTGATGSYEAGRRYSARTGNASRGYDRTVNTPSGRLGQRRARRPHHQRLHGPAVHGIVGDAHRRRREHVRDHTGTATAGPNGYAHAGSGSTDNARTGRANTRSSASPGNNHDADMNGNVYRNAGSDRKKSGTGGWSSAPEASSCADRESQARSAGDYRFSNFVGHSGGFGGRFGGGFRSQR